MEIIKLRKGIGVAAKLIVCGMLILANSVSTAQQLEGNYGGSDGIIYHFKDSTFKTITRMHVGNSIARGSYKVQGDTLYLSFKPFINPPTSYFKFSQRKPIYKQDTTVNDTTSLSVKFIVVDVNNKVLPKTNLLIRREREPINGFVADSLGRFPEIFIFGKNKSSFRFTYIGKKQLLMDADTLMGYNSKVKVILSPAVIYSDYEGTKKYLIEEIEPNKIILLRMVGNKKIVLERTGK